MVSGKWHPLWLGVMTVAAALLVLPAAAAISTSGTSAIGPFTQAQVDQGRIAYNAACATCHGYGFQNGSQRTSLVGRSFLAGWGDRTTWEYYRYVSYRMPNNAPNSLAPETYSAIIAYILAANGAQPGTETLTAQSSVRIDTITDGVVRDFVLTGIRPAGNSQPQ